MEGVWIGVFSEEIKEVHMVGAANGVVVAVGALIAAVAVPSNRRKSRLPE